MIEIVGWSDRQAYKDRDPKWVKLYRSLLRNREWREMPDSASKLLIDLWLLVAEKGEGTNHSRTGFLDMTAEEIAWEVRRDPNSVSDDLATLSPTFVRICTEVYESVPRVETEREKSREEQNTRARCGNVENRSAVSDELVSAARLLGRGEYSDERIVRECGQLVAHMDESVALLAVEGLTRLRDAGWPGFDEGVLEVRGYSPAVLLNTHKPFYRQTATEREGRSLLQWATDEATKEVPNASGSGMGRMHVDPTRLAG